MEEGKIIGHKAGSANITRTDGTYISHYFVLVSDKTTLFSNESENTMQKEKEVRFSKGVMIKNN